MDEWHGQCIITGLNYDVVHPHNDKLYHGWHYRYVIHVFGYCLGKNDAKAIEVGFR